MKKPNWLNFKQWSQTEPIYVIGHKYPDVDSIFASYLLAKILTSKKIPSVFAVLEQEYDFCEEDKSMIQDYLPKPSVVVTNSSNATFLLVDHNDPNQSVGDANIIGCIDHHINTKKIKNIVERECDSTLLLIYDLFKEDYQFDKKEKELIALSVIADTEYLKSSRFQECDQIIYDLLQVSLDVEELIKNTL